MAPLDRLAGRDADPVAVAPDAGVHVEVALDVALVARVAPEVQRHRRHRLHADQLAHGVHQRLAVFAPGLDLRAQAAALHLALSHRQLAVAGDEGAGEVGAAADRVEPDALAVDLRAVVPDPLVALVGQRAAGGADGAQVADRSASCIGCDAGLQAAGEERRAGTEEAAARGAGKAPQRAPVGPAGARVRAAGVAVEHADRGAAQQRRELRVPHDPAGAAVPVEAVAGSTRADVVVQAALQRTRARCRRGRARWAWAGRWCRWSRRSTAGGRRAARRA